jgi:ADP-heptose:LPS heptosyltransferase
MNIKRIVKAYLLKIFTKKKKITFDLNKTTKVLIFRYDRIGDMIVTTPIFRELKKTYPSINITVLASRTNKDVIKYNPYVDKIYTNYKNSFFKDFNSLLKLRAENFDICIELDHSVIPHAIIRHKIIKPKKIISVFKEGRYGVKGYEMELYDFFSSQDDKNHFAKVWLDTLIFLGINSNNKKYDFFLGQSEKDRAISFFSNVTEKFKIGLNIDAFSQDKRLQTSEIKQICHGLKAHFSDIRIFVISGPSNIKINSEIIAGICLDFVSMSYITDTIIDAAALIEQLDLVISPDTSIVHVASAFNIPLVSIHENNNVSYRLWAPTSTLNSTIFALSEKGLLNYNVHDVISSAVQMLKKSRKLNENNWDKGNSL